MDTSGEETTKSVGPLTKEQLEKRTDISQIIKEAIGKSIEDWSDPDGPESEVWPDYFRGEIVDMELPNARPDGENVNYDTEIVFFMAGWQARRRLV